MEQQQLLQLDIDTLKDKYSQAAGLLREALLNGAAWEAVQDYRREVTELEIALYKKLRAGKNNPAENHNRASTAADPY